MVVLLSRGILHRNGRFWICGFLLSGGASDGLTLDGVVQRRVHSGGPCCGVW
jgi:hypothetical protein